MTPVPQTPKPKHACLTCMSGLRPVVCCRSRCCSLLFACSITVAPCLPPHGHRMLKVESHSVLISTLQAEVRALAYLRTSFTALTAMQARTAAEAASLLQCVRDSDTVLPPAVTDLLTTVAAGAAASEGQGGVQPADVLNFAPAHVHPPLPAPVAPDAEVDELAQ